MGVNIPTPEQTTITYGVFEGCHHKSLCVLTLAAMSFTGTFTNYLCLFLSAERANQSAFSEMRG